MSNRRDFLKLALATGAGALPLLKPRAVSAGRGAYSEDSHRIAREFISALYTYDPKQFGPYLDDDVVFEQRARAAHHLGAPSGIDLLGARVVHESRWVGKEAASARWSHPSLKRHAQRIVDLIWLPGSSTGNAATHVSKVWVTTEHTTVSPFYYGAAFWECSLGSWELRSGRIARWSFCTTCSVNLCGGGNACTHRGEGRSPLCEV